MLLIVNTDSKHAARSYADMSADYTIKLNYSIDESRARFDPSSSGYHSAICKRARYRTNA
jgi:hypothetical protein